jgi:hypothetical protein
MAATGDAPKFTEDGMTRDKALNAFKASERLLNDSQTPRKLTTDIEELGRPGHKLGNAQFKDGELIISPNSSKSPKVELKTETGRIVLFDPAAPQRAFPQVAVDLLALDIENNNYHDFFHDLKLVNDDLGSQKLTKQVLSDAARKAYAALGGKFGNIDPRFFSSIKAPKEEGDIYSQQLKSGPAEKVYETLENLHWKFHNQPERQQSLIQTAIKESEGGNRKAQIEAAYALMYQHYQSNPDKAGTKAVILKIYDAFGDKADDVLKSAQHFYGETAFGKHFGESLGEIKSDRELSEKIGTVNPDNIYPSIHSFQLVRQQSLTDANIVWNLALRGLGSDQQKQNRINSAVALYAAAHPPPGQPPLDSRTVHSITVGIKQSFGQPDASKVILSAKDDLERSQNKGVFADYIREASERSLKPELDQSNLSEIEQRLKANILESRSQIDLIPNINRAHQILGNDANKFVTRIVKEQKYFGEYEKADRIDYAEKRYGLAENLAKAGPKDLYKVLQDASANPKQAEANLTIQLALELSESSTNSNQPARIRALKALDEQISKLPNANPGVKPAIERCMADIYEVFKNDANIVLDSVLAYYREKNDGNKLTYLNPAFDAAKREFDKRNEAEKKRDLFDKQVNSLLTSTLHGTYGAIKDAFTNNPYGDAQRVIAQAQTTARDGNNPDKAAEIEAAFALYQNVQKMIHDKESSDSLLSFSWLRGSSEAKTDPIAKTRETIADIYKKLGDKAIELLRGVEPEFAESGPLGPAVAAAFKQTRDTGEESLRLRKSFLTANATDLYTLIKSTSENPKDAATKIDAVLALGGIEDKRAKQIQATLNLYQAAYRKPRNELAIKVSIGNVYREFGDNAGTVLASAKPDFRRDNADPELGTEFDRDFALFEQQRALIMGNAAETYKMIQSLHKGSTDTNSIIDSVNYNPIIPITPERQDQIAATEELYQAAHDPSLNNYRAQHAITLVNDSFKADANAVILSAKPDLQRSEFFKGAIETAERAAPALKLVNDIVEWGKDSNSKHDLYTIIMSAAKPDQQPGLSDTELSAAVGLAKQRSSTQVATQIEAVYQLYAWIQNTRQNNGDIRIPDDKLKAVGASFFPNGRSDVAHDKVVLARVGSILQAARDDLKSLHVRVASEPAKDRTASVRAKESDGLKVSTANNTDPFPDKEFLRKVGHEGDKGQTEVWRLRHSDDGDFYGFRGMEHRSGQHDGFDAVLFVPNGYDPKKDTNIAFGLHSWNENVTQAVKNHDEIRQLEEVARSSGGSQTLTILPAWQTADGASSETSHHPNDQGGLANPGMYTPMLQEAVNDIRAGEEAPQIAQAKNVFIFAHSAGYTPAKTLIKEFGSKITLLGLFDTPANKDIAGWIDANKSDLRNGNKVLFNVYNEYQGWEGIRMNLLTTGRIPNSIVWINAKYSTQQDHGRIATDFVGPALRQANELALTKSSALPQDRPNPGNAFALASLPRLPWQDQDLYVLKGSDDNIKQIIRNLNQTTAVEVPHDGSPLGPNEYVRGTPVTDSKITGKFNREGRVAVYIGYQAAVTAQQNGSRERTLTFNEPLFAERRAAEALMRVQDELARKGKHLVLVGLNPAGRVWENQHEAKTRGATAALPGNGYHALGWGFDVANYDDKDVAEAMYNNHFWRGDNYGPIEVRDPWHYSYHPGAKDPHWNASLRKAV